MKSIRSIGAAGLAGLAVVAMLAGATAKADHGTPDRDALLKGFFHSIEARWEGTGSNERLENDGHKTRTNYDIEVDLNDLDSGSWTSDTEVETESGATYHDHSTYAVRDGNLYVGAYSATEPVQVTELSATQVKYLIRRADLYTGRVYDFTIQFELASRNRLLARTKVELNGVTVSEDLVEMLRH